MKVSYFETGRYQTPAATPAVWPMPSGVYDPGEGARVYEGMIERIKLVEKLGFDWVSLSEHHYSPRILTPSTIVAAANVANANQGPNGAAGTVDVLNGNAPSTSPNKTEPNPQ